jgi:hypothetical protein
LLTLFVFKCPVFGDAGSYCRVHIINFPGTRRKFTDGNPFCACEHDSNANFGTVRHFDFLFSFCFWFLVPSFCIVLFFVFCHWCQLAFVGKTNNQTLSDNGFEGPLDVLGRFTMMEQLFLDNNSFTGNLSFVQFMTRLTVIQTANNKISGPLTYFGNFTQLYALDVSRNQITDTLVSGGLFKLLALTNLYLQNNMITGAAADISTLIQYLPLLQTMNIANNRLAGDFTFDSTIHTKLISLQVNDNSFKNSFKVNFPDSKRIFVLNVMGSSFYCPFPVLPSTVMVTHNPCLTPWVEYLIDLGTKCFLQL